MYTSDHWTDVAKLTLYPGFEDYVGESFKPLGVYLNFFQKTVKARSSRRYAISVVNDHGQTVAGKLALTFENAAGQAAARGETEFEVPAGGQQSYEIDLEAPAQPGEYLLKAAALPSSGPAKTPTASRRRVRVE